MAVSDLTNTTWVINSTTCTAGYGQFDIEFDMNGDSYYMFYIGYRLYGGGDEYRAQANAILISLYPDYLSANDEITITGGTDVTNATLIAWLEANATQQGGGVSLAVTYGGNTIINSSSAGAWTLTCANKYMSTNVVITASGITGRTLTCTYGGNTILSTGNDGTYTLTCGSKKASTAIEITLTGIMVSFTIATHSGDLSCQADQGMTWEQWCSSGYNEHGFYVSGTHIVDSPETWVTNTSSASDYVLKTDTIQNNHTYTLQLNN